MTGVVIRGVFDRKGDPVPPDQYPPHVRRYQQDRQLPDPLCVPLPSDAVCALCGPEGCECSFPGARR